MARVSGGKVRPSIRALMIYLLSAALLGAHVVAPSDRTPLYLAMALIGVAVSSHLYGIAVWRASHQLKISRITPDAAVEGKEVEIRVTVENRTLVPLIGVEIEDMPPKLSRVVSRPSKILLVPPRGRAEFSYRIIPVVGRHAFGRINISARDPLALTSSRVTFEDVESSFVDVAPRTRAVETLPRFFTSIPYMGVSARKKGWGSTFYALREYVEGDETRFIDWKAYARLRRLMVKEYEAEEALSVAILLPVTASMLYGPLGSTVFEVSLRLAAELAYFYLVRGDVVSMIVMDGRGRILYIRDLRGRNSYRVAWRLLSQVSPPEPGSDKPGVGEASAFLGSKAPIYMGSGGYFSILITDRRELVDNILKMRYPALIRKSVSGGVVYLDSRLFGAIERYKNVVERVKVRMKVIEEATALRAAMAGLGYSFVVAGPGAGTVAIARRLEEVAARWR